MSTIYIAHTIPDGITCEGCQNLTTMKNLDGGTTDVCLLYNADIECKHKCEDCRSACRHIPSNADPMKVVMVEDNQRKSFVCPFCDTSIIAADAAPAKCRAKHYCENCGQRLDWNEAVPY